MTANEKSKKTDAQENESAKAPAKRGRPRKVPTINKIVDEYALQKSSQENQEFRTEENTESTVKKASPRRGNPKTVTHENESSSIQSPAAETASEEKKSFPKKGRAQKTPQVLEGKELEGKENELSTEMKSSQKKAQSKTSKTATSPRASSSRKKSPQAEEKPSIAKQEQKENIYNLYTANPLSQEEAPSQSEKAPAVSYQNYNYEDENSPIQLLPSQLTQKISSRNDRVSTRSKVSWQQKDSGRNNQRNDNNNSKQKRSLQKNKSFSEPTFDNSSIIAAITGKNFDNDNFSYNGDTHKAPNNPARTNMQGNNNTSFEQNHKENIHQGDEGSFSFLNGLAASNGSNNQNQVTKQRKIRSPRKATSSLASASMYDEAAPKPLNTLPGFAESALDMLPSDEVYNFNQIVEEKPKAKKGRPKRAKTNEQSETPRSSEYLYDSKSEQHRHSEQLKMFVSVQPDEQVEVVLTENGTVVEYFVEMAHHAKMRGNIYKATIHNVEPNLQAAFVNFGAEKNGFLQIDEVHPDYYVSSHVPTKNHRFPLVSKALKPGQELLVQIVKEPNGSKGAFLTTWISLAGRFLVLTPGQEQLGVSRKVTDQNERDRLRAMLDELNPGKDMGVIIRTAAINASTEELQADLDYLQRLWVDLVNKAQNAPSISLIHQEVELTQRVVRDYLNEDVREIWTDDKEMADVISGIANIMLPQKKNIVKFYSEAKQSLLERYNLQKQIDEITAREIHLPSGGRVTFDQTEALMAIDINSGKTQGKANFQAMVLQTNLEAAKAIARHLRLRDIGGQIVIDFIELRDKNTIKEVENIFKESMKPDRARYEVGHISSFGLLELVRQRIGSSAISISTEPCPHCKGTGIRRNMEWQAQDALKEITKKAKAEKSIKCVYSTDQELALYLLNHKRDRIQDLEEKFNLRIEINCNV